MPITTQWEDTTYVQQLDGKLNFTVTAPTKIDRIMPIRSISSSAPATSNGYIYWDTTEGQLMHYNGSSWNRYEPQSRSGNGVVYYNLSTGYFYEWISGKNLTQISTTAAYRGIYWYLTSITTQPSSANIGDSYFNASDYKIYYYNGFTWTAIGTAVSSRDTTHRYGYMWYVAEEVVVNPDMTTSTYYPVRWYYPTTHKLEYRYKEATLYILDELNTQIYYTIPITTLNGKTYTNSASMVFSTMGGSDLSSTKYRLTVNYTDNSGRTSGADYLPESSVRNESQESEVCFGRGGDSITTTLVQSATLPTYPTTDDGFRFDFTCTPSSSATASVLVPLESYALGIGSLHLKYGIVWTLGKNGGSGGTFNNYTLAQAVQGGYITLSHTGDWASNNFNRGRVGITFRHSGEYTLKTSVKYRTTALYVQTKTDTLTFRVYSKATPSIAVVSSSPSESGDFPPPYTVVLRDTSSTTDAYQIPQQSITMDAGDSADPESWTLENSGTTLITMPDKTHVYNGYGPYRPSLTIVDMNGNTAVGYAQFAPNKEPRIYTPPGETGPVKITCNGTEYQPSSAISGGDAPILLAGTAFVAGSPLPTVTWNYTLQPSSEYYQGEKEGAFAELSLLSGGTYDVTCSITNGTTPLGTYAWTATAQTVTHTDTPVTLQDFVIWIYDSLGNRIDRIMPTSAQYTDRYAHASYCEFTVPIGYPHMQNLLPGNPIAFGYLGRARLMIVSSLGEDADNSAVRITATDAASYALSSRVATTATNSTSGNGYDVQTCSAEALLRYFAVSNIRTGNRQITAMNVVGTCQDAGGRTTYSARYEDILTIFEDICTQSGLGWDSTLQSSSAKTFSLKVVNGIDRTYNDTTGGIVFEERKNGRGSAKVGDYTCIAGSNLAIAAGSGNGSSRQYTEYGATTASGLQRKEVFVDAGDSADALEMQRQAEQELKKQDEQTITVYPNENVYRLGVDYSVGDYVTVRTSAGIMLDLQIIQATLSLDGTGRQLSLECGTDLRDYQRLIRESKLANTYARK